MPTVGGGAADVVDRARGGGDLLRKGLDLLAWGPDERRHRAGRAERGPQLAVHLERERDDGDHHRVPRADLHERLAAAGLDGDTRDELVAREICLIRPEEEVLEREAALAAHTHEVHLAAADEKR